MVPLFIYFFQKFPNFCVQIFGLGLGMTFLGVRFLDLGQLSRQLLQPPVGCNTDVGETQTRYQSVATLNGLNQY